MNPIVSIIVPVYNVGEKIHKCLDSLINQTLHNIEIILVDDGSTDNSGEICDTYANVDFRIKVIHKVNGGVSSARNAGIMAASGKYIQFVDSDDYTDENSCEIMVNAIEKYGVDLIVASYHTVYNDNIMKHICPEKVYNNISDMKENFRLIYLDCFLNSPWNKLFKRDKINKYYDESMRYFEDYFFNLDYIDNINSLATISTPLYYYIEDMGASLTKVFREDIFDVFPKIYYRQKEFCHKYFGDEFDNYLKSSLLYGFYNSAQKLVYSDKSKKYKLNKINAWLKYDVMNTEFDKSVIDFVNRTSNKQFRIGYGYIINKKAEDLYRFLKLKKMINPIVQRIKNISKNKEVYDVNKPNR